MPTAYAYTYIGMGLICSDCGIVIETNIFLRRDTRNLVRQSWDSYSSTYVAAIFELDLRLQQIYAMLPPELQVENALKRGASEDLQRNSFYLNSIYYLCNIFLHASAVPGLSGSSGASDIPHNFMEFCATIALTNANNFSKMAKTYLERSPDLAKIPPFVGYCAFISGSVHAVMARLSRESSIFTPSRAQSIVCLLVLQELKAYYPILGLLVSSTLYCPIQQQIC